MAKQTGIDTSTVREAYQERYRKEHLKIRRDIEKARARASRVMTTRRRTFDQALEKYLRMGFRQGHEQFHHNPTMRFKLASDWHTEVRDSGGRDPRDGMTPTAGASAGAGLVFLDGGPAGTFVNELNPHVVADAGYDDRHGHANASVRVELNFEHSPPSRTTYVWQQYLAMDCRGWGGRQRL